MGEKVSTDKMKIMSIALAVFGLGAGAGAGVIYVSPLGDGSDGRTWPTAYRTIQAGLDAMGDGGGGWRVVVRPGRYVEANLAPAFKGAAGNCNTLVGDFDGKLGSGATGWVIIDSGDPEKGFKSWDWWGPIRSSDKHWPHGNNQETFSSIVWDRWRLQNLYVCGGDGGFFFDLTDKSGEQFTVVVEDCVGTGRAFGGVGFFRGLGDIAGGAYYSEAYGVSGDGAVVAGRSCHHVDYVEPGMPFWFFRGFRWTEAAGMAAVQHPGAGLMSYACAYGVSADGAVVVGESSVQMERGRPCWWDAGGVFHSLAAGTGRATGVSADGSVIVGYAVIDGIMQAFRWTAATGAVGLGSLYGEGSQSYAYGASADGETVVGYCLSNEQGYQAFRWTAAGGMVGLGGLPGGDFSSVAYAVSGDGAVVVGESKGEAGKVAFRWTEEDGMRDLGTIPGYTFVGLAAKATSGDGRVIVGTGYNSTGGYVPFIWDEANGMRVLREVLEAEYGLDLGGWTLTDVTGMSSDGVYLVGRGINAGGQTEAWLAALVKAGDCGMDGDVDMADFAVMAGQWGATGCGEGNGYCGCADADRSGAVDVGDLAILAEGWLGE